MVEIQVFADEPIRKIKPMHCTNNVPAFANEYLLGLFAQAVPYTRFHDTFIATYDRFVDISNIFPDFDADEEDERSYDFAFTDALMKKMQNLGVKPFYRLGVSIENYHAIKAYNIYPPKDFGKWARICEHVIRHYNAGWANGLYMDIEYWEIWNEPDNYPDIKDNQMWKGTFDEYIKLYEITSNYLKSCYPHIKIGGYASCGFYQILENSFAENANVSSRTEYFIECFIKFLTYISSEEHKSPLDFFSWHSYAGVAQNMRFAEYARSVLDKFGFEKTESILNEWNPSAYLRGTCQDASNILANMIALQRSPVDMLMYYDARLHTTYGGLFSPIGDAPNAGKGKPLPSYFSFKAYNELYKLGNEIKTEPAQSGGIYALSAANDEQNATLITNAGEKAETVKLTGIGSIEKIVSNSDKNLYKEVEIKNHTYRLKPYETILVFWSKSM